jgi:hypothetical protein
MKVRVHDLNCNGAIFTIVDQGKDFYIVDSSDYEYMAVRKSHCEPIPEEQQPQFNIGDTVEVISAVIFKHLIGKQGVITKLDGGSAWVEIGNDQVNVWWSFDKLKLIKRQSTDKISIDLSIEDAKVLKTLLSHMGRHELAYVIGNGWKPEVHDECHRIVNDIYCELRDKLEGIE